MRTYLAAGAAIVAAVAGALLLNVDAGHDPVQAGPCGPAPAEPSSHLVVHEWGTFTSFSGSDGVPTGFHPNNSDLPDFVYYQDGDPGSKGGRLYRAGTISMETPVIYFYADREMPASVRVDFPRGWITEWYPFAVNAPSARNVATAATGGQSIRWNVQLLPGQNVRLPLEEHGNHYYRARDTDAAPVRAEIEPPVAAGHDRLNGGNVVQREKFLFYRGVGTFAPLVSVRAVGGGQVRIQNAAGQRIEGLVLLTVREGRISFKRLDGLDAGKEQEEALPAAVGTVAELAEVIVKELTAAGLYEKEARAMVKTWNSAWFEETGTRLLYLVPRAGADLLLPITIEPRPAELVRVLVGRHDFLTPEQEADVERQVNRARAAQAELESAHQEVRKIGRFAEQARQMAEKRLESRAGSR